MKETRRKIATFILATVLCVSGCSESFKLFGDKEPPACSSEEVISTLKRIIANDVYSSDGTVRLFISSIKGNPISEVLLQRQELLNQLLATEMIVSDGYNEQSKKRVCACRASFKDGSPLDISYSVQLEEGKEGAFVVTAARVNNAQFFAAAHQEAAGKALAELYREQIEAKQELNRLAKQEQDNAVIQRLTADYISSKRAATLAWDEADPSVRAALPDIKKSIDANFSSECQSAQDDAMAILRCQRLEADNAQTTIQRAAMEMFKD